MRDKPKETFYLTDNHGIPYRPGYPLHRVHSSGDIPAPPELGRNISIPTIFPERSAQTARFSRTSEAQGTQLSGSTSRRRLLQGELSAGGDMQLYNLIGEDTAMKRLLLVFSLMCVLGFAGQASAALQKKINIFNGAQVEIDTLYISPTNANDWEENILKEETLPNGDKADIEISRTENAEAWDIKVTNKKGESMTWIGVPLNKSGQITLLPNGQYNAQ